MKKKGIWFFGLSGSGKTFLSKKLKKKIKNSFLIDGDEVRKYLSSDLDYTTESRILQCRRLYGIAKISLANKYFPIICSVFLSKEIAQKIKKNNILVIKVIRDNKKVFKKNIYKKNKINLVGKDIRFQKFNHFNFFNDSNYSKKLKELLINI